MGDRRSKVTFEIARERDHVPSITSFVPKTLAEVPLHLGTFVTKGAKEVFQLEVRESQVWLYYTGTINYFIYNQYHFNQWDVLCYSKVYLRTMFIIVSHRIINLLPVSLPYPFSFSDKDFASLLTVSVFSSFFLQIFLSFYRLSILCSTDTRFLT